MGFRSARLTSVAAMLVAALLMIGLRPASVLAAPPAPPFTQCPALGLDTSCARLIDIESSGATVLTDSTQGPYEGVEDNLIGVQNNSGITINSLPLTGSTTPAIFAFDGDGACANPNPTSGLPGFGDGCPFDSTGYAGPGTSFSGISADKNSGTVNFSGGLASGKSAWFTLEGPVTASSICIPKGKVTLSATNPTSGHFNDPVTFSATLTNSCTSAAVSGATLTFTLDGQAGVTGTTNASGVATATITPTEAAGAYTLTVSFAGSTSLLFGSASTTFTVTKEDTALTSQTTLQVFVAGAKATLSATLTDPATAGEPASDAAPIAGQPVKMTLGSGATAQSCTGTTNASGVATCSFTVSSTVGNGPLPITDSFVDATNHYQPATFTQHGLVAAFPDHGSFAIGDVTEDNATATTLVNFWGPSWNKTNAFSALPAGETSAPPQMKGFIDSPSTFPPVCGGTWTSEPGNDSDPPAPALPAFMATIVTSNPDTVAGAPSEITGNIVEIVVIQTNLPSDEYFNAPGHEGTGPIVAELCPSNGASH